MGRSVGSGGWAGGRTLKVLKTNTSTKPTFDNSNILSLPSSSSSSLQNNSIDSSNLQLSTIPSSSSTNLRSSSSCSYSYESDDLEWEWESVNGVEDEVVTNGGYYYYDDDDDDRFLFGQVPSADEVQLAVSALQLFPSAESDLDWIEPSLQVYNPITLQSHGYGRVFDALRLLQTEPRIQRMVVSLSTDKAVWNAVLGNQMVQELRESFDTEFAAYATEDEEPWSSDENPYPTKSILKWILEKTKEKVGELVEKMTYILNTILQSGEEKKAEASEGMFEIAVRSSLLLSVFVLLLVVLARSQRT